MDLTALKADIEATPALAQAFTDGDYWFITKEYAKDHPTATVSKEYMFNKRIFYKNLGLATGLPVIGALEAQTEDADPAVALQAREVLLLLNDLNAGGGVDASNECHDQSELRGPEPRSLASRAGRQQNEPRQRRPGEQDGRQPGEVTEEVRTEAVGDRSDQRPGNSPAEPTQETKRPECRREDQESPQQPLRGPIGQFDGVQRPVVRPEWKEIADVFVRDGSCAD